MSGMGNFRPGDRVAGYAIVARETDGGMARLYRATGAAGEDVLIKVPRLDFGSHPACYTAFEAEQLILGHLAGPHVPRLHASGEADFGPYLVISRVIGTPLAQMAAAAPLPAAEVARTGAALAFALHDIHRQDVVHQDLKPSHAVLAADGTVVLLDFGLASHASLPDLAAAEADGPLGTPAFLAPEQARGRRGDPRSDIFAAGVILYLLATGRLPFGAPASRLGLGLRCWLDPLPPRQIVPAIPAWLQEIILHCLEADPDRRYGSAGLLAHDLDHPDQVSLGERAQRTGRAWRRCLGRLFTGLPAATPRRSAAAQVAHIPHVLVAIDPGQGGEALAQALREAVCRLVAGHPEWRITCVSVLEPSLITGQEEGEELARSLHTERLLALHDWARPLPLPREHLRFHVLTDSDAATSLLAHARAIHADQIVMGARGSSGLRRFLGSVSSRVVAEATCSVTVVRAPMGSAPD